MYRRYVNFTQFPQVRILKFSSTHGLKQTLKTIMCVLCVFCGIKIMNYCREILKWTSIHSPPRISEYSNISLIFQFVHSLCICI